MTDHSLSGPAIIEQKDSTTLLPINWRLTVDVLGHLLLAQEAG